MLIVEDDPDSRELLGELLEERFEVTTASDGQEGLATFRRDRPDVMVTDQCLPDMEGTTLARDLKALFPSASVVLLSGHGRIEHTEACDAVLSKPVDLEKLTAAIEAVLS